MKEGGAGGMDMS